MYAIYARKSRLKEDVKTKSIEDQINEGLRFLEDGEEYKVYEDSGVSGGKPVEERPALSELVADIERKGSKITKVFFLDQSRMERNPNTFAFLTSLFEKHKIEVYQQSGKVEDSEEIKMLRGVMSYANKYYLDSTRKRWRTRHEYLLNQGKALGHIPYGYKRDNDGFLIPDEEKAKHVLNIFQWSLEGLGFQRIADRMNSLGIEPNKNRHKSKNKRIIWQHDHVNSILKNTIYYGERRRYGNVYEAPAIMEREYWGKVNDNIKKNRTRSKVSKEKNQYLLNDLVKCGKCGMNYYGVKNAKNRMNAYQCSSKRRNVARPEQHNCGNRSINIDALDSLIWMEFFGNGEFEKSLKEHTEKGKNAEHRKGLETQLVNYDKLIKAEDKKLNNLVTQIMEGSVLSDKLEAKAVSVQSVIDRYKKEQSKVKENLRSLEVDLTKLNEAKGKKIDFETKRAVIKQYIARIEILYKEPNYFVRIWFAVDGMEDKVYGLHRNYYVAKSYNTLHRSGELVHYYTLNLGLGEGLMLLKGAKNYVEEWN